MGGVIPHMESVAQTPSFTVIVLTGCIRCCSGLNGRLDQFCFLGDMLSACEGAEASLISCISHVGNILGSFCLFFHLKYFCTILKESYIQLVSEVSCFMAVKPGH